MTDKKILPGAMIVTATVVGGGMFSLPVAFAGAWFTWGVIILVISCFFLLTSGLMLLEANLHFDVGASFDKLTQELLGNNWRIVVGFTLGFVLYILTYAYISGASAVISKTLIDLHVPITSQLCGIITTIIIATIIWWGSTPTGRITSVLFIAKVIAFFLTFAGLLTHVHADFLSNTVALTRTHHAALSYAPYVFMTLSFCTVSFGFHGNVPSLVKHYGNNASAAKKIHICIVSGSLIALIIYIFWLLVTMGNIPRDDFGPVIAQGGNVDVFLTALGHLIKAEWINIVMTFFGNLAIICSLLAATLGLFDYMADLFKLPNNKMGRAKAAIITYLPPLLVWLIWPNGFIFAIGFAGLAFAVWGIILPAMLVNSSRQKYVYTENTYKCFGGKFLIYVVNIFGALAILSQILLMMNLIPSFI